MGGQTGLNLFTELFEKGILEASGVEMIGAKPEAQRARTVSFFKQALDVSLDVAKSFSVNSLEEAQSHLDDLGDFPIILRPATLGRNGRRNCLQPREFDQMMVKGWKHLR